MDIKIHIAGPKQPVQRCVRCKAKIGSHWSAGHDVSSDGRGNMSDVTRDPALRKEIMRECGKSRETRIARAEQKSA
jgi:hypothetical protein